MSTRETAPGSTGAGKTHLSNTPKDSSPDPAKGVEAEPFGLSAKRLALAAMLRCMSTARWVAAYDAERHRLSVEALP